MYAGTKVNWHEVLMADSTASSLDDSLPLFLCAFSADKGSEEITDLVYSDFKKMYGNNADFFKYGQPLMQAHKILAAGGRVLGKRIVASDATLANLIIVAKVTSVEEQKVDSNGQKLYIGADGKETTDSSSGVPANITKAKIEYETYSLNNAMDIDAVEAYAKAIQTDSKFPLFVICDNGRGKSIKRVRISPDYEVSKKLPYMLYKISDIENANVVETQRFSVYPDAVNNVNGIRKNMALIDNTMLQMRTKTVTSGMNAFVETISGITGYTVEELYAFDILFGKTVKQKEIPSITVGGTDIANAYGLELTYGSNGAFNDAPFEGTKCSDAWKNEAIKFFNGEFSDEIFDLDQHKIDFCFDANYPDEVKEAICDLAKFREDFFYFRDLGTEVNSVADVEEKVSMNNWAQTPFVSDNMSTYDIIDPFSHKQVKVTMCHGIAPLMVAHFATNAAAPVAGEFNNFVITEAVEGTLNIIPRVTPRYDQKEILDNLRVNYLNLTSDRLLAVQSTYTSQDHEGPLSYANNVIITQSVIKAIRRYCPKIRFMLMDVGATDFGKYKTLIEDNVISRYAQFFKSIELKYTRDDEQIAAKIFNASLYCYYRDFPQGEIFDVFAIEGSPDTNPIVEA